MGRSVMADFNLDQEAILGRLISGAHGGPNVAQGPLRGMVKIALEMDDPALARISYVDGSHAFSAAEVTEIGASLGL